MPSISSFDSASILGSMQKLYTRCTSRSQKLISSVRNPSIEMKCRSCGDTYELGEASTQLLRCKECHTISERDAGPLYQCTWCSTIFTKNTSAKNNHQCPRCNKFGLKIAESGCIVCNGEMELIDVVECPTCGALA